jgi:hypothetical protein
LYKTSRKNQKAACLTYHIFLELTSCIILILVSHFDESLTAQVCTTCCPSRHLLRNHHIHLHHLIHQNHLDPGSTQRLSYGGFKTDSISFGIWKECIPHHSLQKYPMSHLRFLNLNYPLLVHRTPQYPVFVAHQ